MDRAFAQVCDSICIAGPHGISVAQLADELKEAFKLETLTEAAWSYFLSLFSQLEPEFALGRVNGEAIRKGDRNRLITWAPMTKLIGVTMDDTEARIFCTKLDSINSTLLDGRLIALPENSLLALQVIGYFGRNGVNQAELARFMNCESRTIFHFLKLLMQNDLIIRTPISTSKMFTYQLTLSRFEDDEMEADDPALRLRTNVSSVELRQLIIDVLSKAPNQTLNSPELFAASGLHRSTIKILRRAILYLESKGVLEISIDHRLKGHNLRVFRLLRSDYNKPIDIKMDTSPVFDCEFDPNVPIVNQLVRLVAQAYPEGILASEICARLGIGTKYLYRLVDHVFSPKNEGLVKIADFLGKEKRLKFFVKDSEWQRRYLELSGFEAPSSTPLPSQISSLLSSRPSSPLSSVSSTATLARHVRHEAIIAELEEKRILEVGKVLANRVQERTGDNKHVLDVKTLRRSIEILAAEGKLIQVNVSVPSGSKTIAFVPEFTVESAEDLEYISFLREGGKAPRVFSKIAKISRLEQAQAEDPSFFEPVEEDDASLPLAAQNRNALEKFGFVQGVMIRAALLHKHLLQYKCSTIEIDSIYDSLTFGEFLELIGLVRMSRELFARRFELSSIALSELDSGAKEELTWSRKRFHVHLLVLLQMLSQLQIISDVKEEETRLPSEIELNEKVFIAGREFNFAQGDYERYWSALKAHSLEQTPHVSSIYDAEEPRSRLLIRHPDSWKRGWKRHRELVREVKKLAQKVANTERSKRRRVNTTNPIEGNSHQQELARLAQEYEESIESIGILLSGFLEELQQLPKTERKVSFEKEEEVDDFAPGVNESKQTSPFSEEEHMKLELGFALLQHPLFLSADGSFKWQLITQTLNRQIDSAVIRRQGLKVCRNYDELLRILEYDVIVQIVLSAVPTENLEFKEAFELCWASIDCEDLFSNASGLELLPGRKEYFWDILSEWSIARSFRHEFARNQKGLLKTEHIRNVHFCELALALRRVLVATNFDDFDSEAAFKFLENAGGTDDAILNAALETLFQSGFAVKTRNRSRFRLLGFPVALSEAARKLLVGTEDDSPDSCWFDEFGRESERLQRLSETLTTITANTNNPLFHNFAHEAILELLKMNLEITDLGKVTVNYTGIAAPVLDFASLQTTQSALWRSFDDSFNETVARRCLRAVERLVKNSPGLVKAKIYSKLPLLLPTEIDACLQFLQSNFYIMSLNDHYE